MAAVNDGAGRRTPPSRWMNSGRALDIHRDAARMPELRAAR